MKISKEFRWEMGHRLPLHDGLCKNVHGHSYKLLIEISGEVNKNGMIIDFFDLSNIIQPLLDKFDHAFMCSEDDLKMKTGMNLGQLLSIPFVLAGIILILYSKGILFRRNKKVAFNDA